MNQTQALTTAPPHCHEWGHFLITLYVDLQRQPQQYQMVACHGKMP